MASTNVPRAFAREFKPDLCRQIKTGQKRPTRLCREHQLTEGLILRWRREFELRGEAAFSVKKATSPLTPFLKPVMRWTPM